MEDLKGDKYQWIMVDLSTKQTKMLAEHWGNLERKEKSIIWLCMSESIVFNVLGESVIMDLWFKLGTLY